MTCTNIYNNIDILKRFQGTNALEFNAMGCEWINVHKNNSTNQMVSTSIFLLLTSCSMIVTCHYLVSKRTKVHTMFFLKGEGLQTDKGYSRGKGLII